jgi:hypothetical protein
VHKFIAYNDPKAKSGADGFYEKTTRDISLRKGTIDKQEDNEYNREDHEMTEAQAVEALGSQEAFQTFVDQKRLIKQANGTYKFAPHKTDEFSLTVLHEVGHSVDAMLGEKTEFTYGQAGWKRFPVSDFEGWAKDLGGWDSVSATDQKEIARVWRTWLNGGGKGTAKELVDEKHPLNNGTYSGVGVVDLAADGSLHKYGGASAGVRRGMVRHSSQEFFSMSAKAYDASPSNYALSAPEEYFAECYAHYYIGFAEGSSKVKGEAVAPWIKKWFDANIDTVGHNPIRNRNG